MKPVFHLINHPLITHKLSIMRDKSTSPVHFRGLLKEISMLLAYEVTRDLSCYKVEIETPVAKMFAEKVHGDQVTIISILRAGNGLLGGILELIPTARVGHIGLARDHETLQPTEYYRKFPDQIDQCEIIVVDPMLATGHSASAAIKLIKDSIGVKKETVEQQKKIKFVCLLAAPEGVKQLQNDHPDVPIYTAALDEKLNESGYIVPGLGDAGDRIYGTV